MRKQFESILRKIKANEQKMAALRTKMRNDLDDAEAIVKSLEEGHDDITAALSDLQRAADCVMAGMARTGSVYPLNIDPTVLMKAFQNTVELLKSKVVVKRGTL